MAGSLTVVKKTRKIGRPSLYSQELADEICERLGNGESLRRITRDDGMPEGRTVWKWLRIHPEFVQQYTRAKEESADAFAEDIIDVAEDVRRGRLDPNAGRVTMDAYKWTASKLKPKKYGDKVDLTTNGKDLPTPILGQIPTSDTIRDVMEGEIVNEVSQNAGLIQKGNIIDEIIGDNA